MSLPARQGLVWLELSVFERYGRQYVAWGDAAGQPAGTSQRLAALKTRAPAPPPAPGVSRPVTFGAALQLTGYDLAPAARPGETLAVGLHWQALAAPAADYVVSVQVLDEDGRLVAQHDSPPMEGNYPTSFWEPGETVLDDHHVPLPAGLRPGTYRVMVVVYAAQTGQRLRAGQDDQALLATLRLD